jgi:hypothetical protein
MYTTLDATLTVAKPQDFFFFFLFHRAVLKIKENIVENTSHHRSRE